MEGLTEVYTFLMFFKRLCHEYCVLKNAKVHEIKFRVIPANEL